MDNDLLLSAPTLSYGDNGELVVKCNDSNGNEQTIKVSDLVTPSTLTYDQNWWNNAINNWSFSSIQDTAELDKYKKKISILDLSISGGNPNLADYTVYHVHPEGFDKLFSEKSLQGHLTSDTTWRFSGIFLVSAGCEIEVFLGSIGIVYIKNVPSIWKLDREEVLKILIP